MQHRIVIRGNSATIEPGHTVVGQGDVLLFSVQESESAEISFPGPVIFASGNKRFMLELHAQPHAETISGPVGTHPFSAYCTTQNKFAKGGSDGEIIIQG